MKKVSAADSWLPSATAHGDAWQGMPPVTPHFSNVHGERCVSLADRWLGVAGAPFAVADVEGWSSPHYISFLEHLMTKLTEASAASSHAAPPCGLADDALTARSGRADGSA